MRLIDADALTKKYCREKAKGDCVNCDWYGDSWCRGEIYGVQVIDAPTIDAVPVVHGRWVDHMVRDWRCSECGEKINKIRNVDGYCYNDKPNFCPNCGAKMEA